MKSYVQLPVDTQSAKHGCRMIFVIWEGRYHIWSESWRRMWIECGTSSKPPLSLQIKPNIFLPCPALPQSPHPEGCPVLTDYFQTIYFLNYFNYLRGLGSHLTCLCLSFSIRNGDKAISSFSDSEGYSLGVCVGKLLHKCVLIYVILLESLESGVVTVT